MLMFQFAPFDASVYSFHCVAQPYVAQPGYLRLCSVCCTSLVGALAVLHQPIAFQGWGDAGRLEEFVIQLQRAVAQHK